MTQNPTPAIKKKVETTAQRLNSLIKSCRDIMRKDRGLSSDVDRLPQLTSDTRISSSSEFLSAPTKHHKK